VRKRVRIAENVAPEVRIARGPCNGFERLAEATGVAVGERAAVASVRLLLTCGQEPFLNAFGDTKFPQRCDGVGREHQVVPRLAER
jgi:hypothetical protein